MADVERRLKEGRARMLTLVPEQMARIDWPREKLDAYRQDRLRGMLTHAIEHSAWHRERLSHVDPQEIRVDDLRDLPVMTKADLTEHFDAISTDPRVTRARCEQHMESGADLLDGEFAVMASGGTTGVRAISATHLDSMVETSGAGLIRFVKRWARRTGLSGSLERPFMVVSAPGHHASNVLKHILGGGHDRSASVVEPIAEVVAALNAADPAHVIVYSSFIPHLAEEAKAGRLHIRPKIVTPVAESFLPEHEAAAAEAWGPVIMSSWGATETGMLGAGSGFDSGMLLLDDEAVVEPVDASGEPVLPGVEADKLLVTALSARLMPLVRYELTDQLTVIDAPATCGSAFTRISYVRGRQDEEFVYAGGLAVHAHTFRTVLSRERAIAEYQVEQTPTGAHLRALLAASATELDHERIAAKLVERLAHVGVSDPEVEVSVVSEIPRTPGASKLRRFVPLAAPSGAVRAPAGASP